MSTILCIDDDPVVCAALERRLTELGHEPLLATSIEEALLALASHNIELVISNYPMPGASATGLLAMLRERSADVPIILMTEYSRIELAITGMRDGADGYVSKPLRAETLRLVLTHGMEAARLRSENQCLRREIAALRGPGESNGESAAAHESESREVMPINLRELERIAIGRALAATGGRRIRAAELLGISERTLRNKLNTSHVS